MWRLHPGSLGKIVGQEILRYYDSTLNSRHNAAVRAATETLAVATNQVHRRHSQAVDGLRSEYQRIGHELAVWRDRANLAWHGINENLANVAPDLSDFEWPESGPVRERTNPLCDGLREYVDQIDCYKSFQGKPTTRKVSGGGQ
jgi:hypothetical protein